MSDIDELWWRIKNKWTVWITLFTERAVGDVMHCQRLCACVRAGGRYFEHMITMYTFYNFWDNNCRWCLWLFIDSLKCTCMYCVNGSICDFSFPKLVLAHILDEVKNFCVVLSSISFLTCQPVLIEIGSYLTNTEQKYVGERFWDTVTLCMYCFNMASLHAI